jgi:hypothetical protein
MLTYDGKVLPGAEISPYGDKFYLMWIPPLIKVRQFRWLGYLFNLAIGLCTDFTCL